MSLLAWPSVALASPVTWLYEVDVEVEAQTASARETASRAALVEVLTRVSGLAHVPRNRVVLSALDAADRYYSRFVFLADDELRIYFDPPAILQLAKAAELPIWSSNRPETVAWVVVEEGGTREIVYGDHPLAEALRARAIERGVALRLPLMDLQDQIRIDPAVVWGRFSGAIAEASERYGADVIAVGRLQRLADGTLAGSFEHWLDGQPTSIRLNGLTDEVLAGDAIDSVVNALAGRYAVLGRELNVLRLPVDGIDSPATYGQLLRYFNSLEFVDDVAVEEVDGERLVLAVATRARMDQMMQLLENDGRILLDPLGNQLSWRGPSRR